MLRVAASELPHLGVSAVERDGCKGAPPSGAPENNLHGACSVAGTQAHARLQTLSPDSSCLSMQSEVRVVTACFNCRSQPMTHRLGGL